MNDIGMEAEIEMHVQCNAHTTMTIITCQSSSPNTTSTGERV